MQKHQLRTGRPPWVDVPSRHVPEFSPSAANRAESLSRTRPLFGLAPCGVYPAPGITARAVRSYRTFSPLPQRSSAVAVYFLWHWPSTGLKPGLPDVIRHTALWSSDFPPPASRGPARAGVHDRERPSDPAALFNYMRCEGSRLRILESGRWVSLGNLPRKSVRADSSLPAVYVKAS